MLYQRATESELESLWNRNIAENGNDKRWIDWKREFIENNRSGKAAWLFHNHRIMMLQSGRAHYYYHLRAVQLQAEKYYVMGKKLQTSMLCEFKRDMKDKAIFLN
ncbi:MAG: hypothetical protein ACLTB5_00745 [Acutalibacteraceae bacterium]